ncbi:MAG: SUMF1/EgtB/PvdO family nonheme iron enzyme [Planctomycetota bacterium]|nr:SUMF1/EgtB/PvdO family nonheme iron enzyme [Planctomycetota bacterium]
MERPLDELERRRWADPKDWNRFEALIVARSRVEGPSVYLELLNDRILWNRCSPALQDGAIDEAFRCLGPAFELLRKNGEKATVYRCGGQEQRIATARHKASSIELNLIPGGSFHMGPLGREYLREGDSRWREVTFARPFLVGRTPILQSHWDRIGGVDERVEEGDDYPIDHVTWDSIQDWLERLGDGLRLPTEEEWEYACRAGTTTKRYWGEAMDDRHCWHFENSEEKAHRVSEHEGFWNAFGLLDMLGNVLEFCSNQWDGVYHSGPNVHLPPELTSDLNHILRGSSLFHHVPGAKSGTRFVSSPRASAATGFRAAESIESV